MSAYIPLSVVTMFCCCYDKYCTAGQNAYWNSTIANATCELPGFVLDDLPGASVELTDETFDQGRLVDGLVVKHNLAGNDKHEICNTI